MTGGPHLYECRDDGLHRPVDHLEAVGIVQTHDSRSHEGEDRHDVVKDLLLETRGPGHQVLEYFKGSQSF